MWGANCMAECLPFRFKSGFAATCIICERELSRMFNLTNALIIGRFETVYSSPNDRALHLSSTMLERARQCTIDLTLYGAPCVRCGLF